MTESSSTERARSGVPVRQAILVVAAVLFTISGVPAGAVGTSLSTVHTGTAGNTGPTADSARASPAATGGDRPSTVTQTASLESELDVAVDCVAGEVHITTDRNQEYRVFVVVENRSANQSEATLTNVSGPVEATAISLPAEGRVNVIVQNASINESVGDSTVLVASRDCSEPDGPSVPSIDCENSEAHVTAPETYEYTALVTVTLGPTPIYQERSNTTGNATITFQTFPGEVNVVSALVLTNETTELGEGLVVSDMAASALVSCVPATGNRSADTGRE